MSFFSKIKGLASTLAEQKRKKLHFFLSLIAGRINYEASYPGLYRNSLPALAPKPFSIECPEAVSLKQPKSSEQTWHVDPTGGIHTAAKTAGRKEALLVR